MLEALSLILLFQLLGEAVAWLFRLPLPGPVIGMVLLFIAWPRLARLRESLESVSGTLLVNLGLLFVPAGVGIVLHVGLIADWWLALLLAVLVSTAVAMALAAIVYDRLRRRAGR